MKKPPLSLIDEINNFQENKSLYSKKEQKKIIKSFRIKIANKLALIKKESDGNGGCII